MIRKKINQPAEIRRNMQGGIGEVVVKHYFKNDEINAPCRFCAQFVLAPGARIGLHGHTDEDEIIIVQQGKALVNDNGREAELDVGDSLITSHGEMHSIKNIGYTDLIVISIIVQYSFKPSVVI